MQVLNQVQTAAMVIFIYFTLMPWGKNNPSLHSTAIGKIVGQTEASCFVEVRSQL